MKVVQYHRSALSRQVGEAIRIYRRGITLNSKGGYNRSALTRLTLVEEEEEVLKEWEAGIEKDYTTGLFKKRKEMDRLDRLDRAGRAIEGTGKEVKRKDEQNEQGGGRRKKKRRYEVIQGDWGEGVKGKKVETSEGLVDKNDGVDSKSENVNEKNVEILTCMNSKNVTETASTSNTPKSPDKLVKVEQNVETKPVYVKKVWTKLRNGLYGWRRVTTARRRCPPSSTPPRSRQGKKEPREEKTEVSTKQSVPNSNSTATTMTKKFQAREADFNGCGTALDQQQFFEGNFENEVCRPGHTNKSESRIQTSENGREGNNSEGSINQSSSGVNRGQGV